MGIREVHQAIALKAQGVGPACQLMCRVLAQKVGVPYHEDRLVERFLGHRFRDKPETPFVDGPRYGYQGEVLEAWPNNPETGKPAAMHEVQFLTEEVWSRDFWPNTADDVAVAVNRLPDGQITGLYYHGPSMTIVLLHPGGVKVGIRALSLIHPQLGPDRKSVVLLDRLKKWNG